MGEYDYTDPSWIDVDVVIGNIEHEHRMRGHRWTDQTSWPNVTVLAMAREIQRLRRPWWRRLLDPARSGSRPEGGSS